MRDTAGAAPSVGSVGDALAKPMAEGLIRLFQTELIRRGLGRGSTTSSRLMARTTVAVAIRVKESR